MSDCDGKLESRETPGKGLPYVTHCPKCGRWWDSWNNYSGKVCKDTK